ncbi:MAG: prephenate dehydrogenase [Nocardioides sp.]|uniref:prephenate dehydrogenase n=1 Tax=Nocardioides nematodiphilus TaxID=2849669 RepID=UPI001CD9BFC9|nr:prephenate dehydrogenase [Nocardioides nematodiphilus]MCA1983692.1 prephenate dehydrogenase [Nocardioides nematodiphilus]
MPDQALSGPVEIIGTGLLGTSIALACRQAGLEVLLTDASPENVRTASGMGAGRPRLPGDRPQLVVVAVPPAYLGRVIAEALSQDPDAIVTDVGSVKSAPLLEVAPLPGADRYIGSHPMAGTERSGPLAGNAALFDGRPWAVTPHAGTRPDATALVEQLALLCGAVPIRMDPAEHDRAVARISHVPHLMAVLVAGRLAGAPADHLALSGPGVRDVTRVAGGDPELYSQIVTGNSGAVVDLLSEVRHELDELISALRGGDRGTLAGLLERGQEGTRAIPGKHGGPLSPTTAVFVAVADEPGGLARLFADAGASGVNIEDVRIEHELGRPAGLVELVVAEGSAEQLRTALESRGWVVHR